MKSGYSHSGKLIKSISQHEESAIQSNENMGRLIQSISTSYYIHKALKRSWIGFSGSLTTLVVISMSSSSASIENRCNTCISSNIITWPQVNSLVCMPMQHTFKCRWKYFIISLSNRLNTCLWTYPGQQDDKSCFSHSSADAGACSGPEGKRRVFGRRRCIQPSFRNKLRWPRKMLLLHWGYLILCEDFRLQQKKIVWTNEVKLSIWSNLYEHIRIWKRRHAIISVGHRWSLFTFMHSLLSEFFDNT